jgi:hypothetical protein
MLTDLPEQQQQSITIGLFIWTLVVSLVTCNQWNNKKPGVGLPLVYLFNLSLNHFFGAMVYILPWYRPKSAILLSQGASLTNTALGFQQSVYGIIGFGVGSIIVAPLLLKVFNFNKYRNIAIQPNLDLPKIYIVLGLLFYFVLSPIFSRVPSFSSLVSFGFPILASGLCLACWKSWCLNDKKAFLHWFLLSCLIPVFSMVNAGFLSFGIMALSIVLMFILNFYRPRWQLIPVALLILFLGSSFLVTYFRDREQLRQQVWKGNGIEARVEQVWNMVSKFEFFDPSVQRHLEVIDARFNINTIVGMGVNRISTGTIDTVHGETLEEAAMATVPRILWPNKPVKGGSGDLAARFSGLKYPDGTSVGIGNVAEFYFNFGTLGVVFGLCSLGTALRMIDLVAAQKLISGDWVGFFSWFLPGIALIAPQGSLVEVGGCVPSAIILVNLINKFYLPYVMKKRKERLHIAPNHKKNPI